MTVSINAQLAVEYRQVYEGAFGNRETRAQSLEKFIGGFIEDRLIEEIEFAKSEALRSPK